MPWRGKRSLEGRNLCLELRDVFIGLVQILFRRDLLAHELKALEIQVTDI